VYYVSGQIEQFLATARDAVRLDPTPIAYWQLAWAYANLGRLDEARTTIQQAEANHVDPAVFGDLSYAIAFLQNDAAAMDRASAGPWLFEWPGAAEVAQANTAAYHGQLARSRQFTERAIASAKQQGNLAAGCANQVIGALTEALLGSFPEAKQVVSGLGKCSPDPSNEGNMALILAVAGDIQQAQRIADDLRKRYPENTYLRFSALPAVEALAVLRQDKADEAISALSPVSSRDFVSP